MPQFFATARRTTLCALVLAAAQLAAALSHASGPTYSFTHAGATGRFGPTQAQVDTAYGGTNLSGQVTITTQGIQEWTVPFTGNYAIEVAGAQSGDYNGVPTPGLGRIIRGELALTEGTNLRIIVGQMGLAMSNNDSSHISDFSSFDTTNVGGGGGSFVFDDGTLLFAAGGGGGANGFRQAAGGGANFGTHGSGGTGVGAGAGGTNGAPGGGFTSGSNGSGGVGEPGDGQGGGGGGLGDVSATFVGGARVLDRGSEGGFGGGGSSAGGNNVSAGGGGGGGYSGGGGGAAGAGIRDGGGSGGGGGSFGSTAMTDEGTHDGHGYVTLTRLTCTTPEVPVSLSASGTGGTTADLSWSPGSPAGSATVTYAWRVKNSAGSVVQFNSTTSTSTSVTGLSEGTTYTFTVQANTSCDDTNSAESGNSASFTTFVESFAGGSGTQADPYQIENWNHLNNIRNHLSSHFVLNNDIDQGSDGYTTHVKDGATLANGGLGWQPIGKSNVEFKGVLDGANRSISDLEIQRANEDQVGLFGATAGGGRVLNLALLNVSVTGNFWTAALVGNARVGAGALSNLSVTGQVTSNSNRIGCLIGENYVNVSDAHVDCTVVGGSSVGGLIGDNRSAVERSSSAGSVNGSTSVGGLLGRSTRSVQKSFSRSQVSGDSEVGGLIGQNSNSVLNTYAIGTVTGWDGDTTGGLIGINGDKGSTRPGGNVSNSFATGLVNGAPANRAFIGSSVEDQFTSPSYSNNFFDTDTTNQTAATASSATALTTSQMKTQTTFTNAGWDFTANTGIWAMEQGTYLSYPYLQGIAYDSPQTSPATQPIPGLAKLPGAPTSVSATATNAQATVSWTAPTDSGDSAITAYTVTSSPDGQTCSTNGAITCVVTGLTNGTSYTFTVSAMSSVGTGQASAPSNAVTPATVPGTPTITSTTAGNAQASIVFNAPVSDGGAAITGYTATSNPGGLTGTCSASPCVVTDLTNGIEYTFTMTATNQLGTGAPSSPSSAVTPKTTPAAPINVVASPGSGQARIHFDAGDNGGDAISNYAYSLDGGSTWNARVPAATTSPWIIEGLNNDTEYSVKIRAINSVGEGLASETVVVCPSAFVFKDQFRSQGGGSPRCL